MTTAISKTLSANDVGLTGGHQAGILVPKEPHILAFFPALDPATFNPDAWLVCEDDVGNEWKLRFIYYNNRLHADNGTRNEYRLTHLTKFLKQGNAAVGDILTFTATSDSSRYRISLMSATTRGHPADAEGIPIIKLRGWRVSH